MPDEACYAETSATTAGSARPRAVVVTGRGDDVHTVGVRAAEAVTRLVGPADRLGELVRPAR